jgi:GNAT superfamily N-acetyltransferase
MKAKPQLKFYPATPARWPDVEEVFGARGACAGCWCMFWRLPRKQWKAQKGIGNKKAFREIVEAKRSAAPGILAYISKEAVGWCAVAPRSEYVRLDGSRILKPVDENPVWSISCLFVKRGFRRQGISAALAKAAAGYALKKGARIVEAYPVDPSVEKEPDPYLWHGVTSSFEKAGFKEVARRAPARPIMRLEVAR